MCQPCPPLFKWRHFEPAIITCAVGWYLRFSLSYRDVEELLTERGLSADHTTIWRWVQRYAPELHKRCRRELKPTNGSWRVDETYIRVKGTWAYLYRAVDSCGASIDFLLSAHRDAAAAKRFFQRALQTPSSQGFRSFQGARRTIEGYETVHGCVRVAHDRASFLSARGTRITIHHSVGAAKQVESAPGRADFCAPVVLGCNIYRASSCLPSVDISTVR